MTRELVLIGAGYLSGFLAEQVEADVRVLAVCRTRRAKPGAAVATWRQVNVDVWSSAAHDALAAAIGGRPAMACVLLPPSAYPAAGLRAAIGRLGETLHGCGVERLVLTSSTGVYDGTDSVDADTPARPSSVRAQRLLEIENAWCEAMPDGRVLRLAGLYGPGRIIGLGGIRNGTPLPGTGSEWLNLLDARDAARGLLAALACAAAPPAGPLSDGVPVERRRYYTALARLSNAPLPHFDSGVPPRGASRRCAPAATWAALGCAPVYTDFEANLRTLVTRSG